MIYDKHIASRFDVVKSVSSITHAHTRSVLACFYYLEFARLLLQGKDKKAAYCILQEEIPAFLHSINIPKTEFDIFKSLIYESVDDLSEQNFQSKQNVRNYRPDHLISLQKSKTFPKVLAIEAAFLCIFQV